MLRPWVTVALLLSIGYLLLNTLPIFFFGSSSPPHGGSSNSRNPHHHQSKNVTSDNSLLVSTSNSDRSAGTPNNVEPSSVPAKTSQWTVRNKLSRGRFAVFTIVKNEPVFLRMWLRHYVREFPREDMYVINNGGNDTIPSEFAGVNLVMRVCEQFFDHHCIIAIVERMLLQLLKDGYTYVIFAEADELIYIDQGICNYLKRQSAWHINVHAFEVYHFPDDELSIDWNQELVGQRKFLVRNRLYDKALIHARGATFGPGFHLAKDIKAPHPRNFKFGRIENRDDEVLMIHMQKIDYEYFIEKGEWKAKQNHHADVHRGFGGQHAASGDLLVRYFWFPVDNPKFEFRTVSEEFYRRAAVQFNADFAQTCISSD